MRCGLVIPTYNGGEDFKRCIESVAQQSLKLDKKVLWDSSSKDATAHIAEKAGFEVFSISPDNFNHGKSRQDALAYLEDCEVVIFLTQDVTLAEPHSLKNLIKAFEDPQTAMAFGRQLPYSHHSPLARHARFFNYPSQSYRRCYQDRQRYGIKTIFFSNAFSAYRLDSLHALGGFPSDIILGEDVYMAAKTLSAGKYLQYTSQALAYHSHPFSLKEEFKSYFDYGVFHKMQASILKPFASVHQAGWRYAASEWRYILKHAFYLLPLSFLRTFTKYFAYQMGKRYKSLPQAWCKALSRHPRFWNKSSL